MKYCIKHKLNGWFLSAEGTGWTLRNNRKLFDKEEEAWEWARKLPDANIDFLEVLRFTPQPEEEKEMIEERTWQEFRNTGLLLFINQFLHIFGWSIVLRVNSLGNIEGAFPARSKFRGFDEKSQNEAYEKLTKVMEKDIVKIKDGL